MTWKYFKENLVFAIKKKYPCADILINPIQWNTYDINYSSRFHIPVAINFKQHMAIVIVTESGKTEIFLAFIDKKGRGCICSEDKEDRQNQSSIANFKS
ncbi:MAG: hypothetical protein WC663_00625 [Patescibacteria group bacterium]|jgi:hypothetical protein